MRWLICRPSITAFDTNCVTERPRIRTKQNIYTTPKCALRRKVAEALSRVQVGMKLAGGGLKVFDCYRPVAVQERIWDGVSDKVLAEDPREGGFHSRGIAVDVTLLNKTGTELEMPSPYGVWPSRLPGKQGENASANYRRLVEVMRREGFAPVNELWWHFVYRTAKNILSKRPAFRGKMTTLLKPTPISILLFQFALFRMSDFEASRLPFGSLAFTGNVGKKETPVPRREPSEDRKGGEKA